MEPYLLITYLRGAKKCFIWATELSKRKTLTLNDCRFHGGYKKARQSNCRELLHKSAKTCARVTTRRPKNDNQRGVLPKQVSSSLILSQMDLIWATELSRSLFLTTHHRQSHDIDGKGHIFVVWIVFDQHNDLEAHEPWSGYLFKSGTNFAHWRLWSSREVGMLPQICKFHL